MSGFDLIIEFGGMCLFVPDGDDVTVLMPRVDHHKSDGEHAPRLYVHEKYFKSEDQKNACKSVGNLRVIPLTGKALTFAVNGETADGDSVKGKDIAPLSEHLRTSVDHASKKKDKVRRRFLAGALEPEMASRVTLKVGGMLTVTCSGSWNLGERRGTSLAISAKWRIDGIEAFPDIPVGGAPLALAPPERERLVVVHVFHTLPEDNPTAEPTFVVGTTDATHFPAYYHAFDLPVNETSQHDVPHYLGHRTTGSPPSGETHDHNHVGTTHRSPDAPEAMSGRRITCLMAEGEPEKL